MRLEGLRLLRELPAIGRLTSAGASYAEPVLKQSFILAYGSHERFSWPTTLPEFSLNGETERNASIGFCEVPGPRIVSPWLFLPTFQKRLAPLPSTTMARGEPSMLWCLRRRRPPRRWCGVRIRNLDIEERTKTHWSLRAWSRKNSVPEHDGHDKTFPIYRKKRGAG